MLTYSSHRGARFSALCNLLLASFIFVTFVAPRTALGQLPIGQWTFDQAQGTQETDVSSHGHTASLMNGVSRVGTPVGEGVAADASTRQYIRIPPIDLTQTKGATVTLWVNRLYSTSGTTTLLEASEDYRRSATGFTVSPDDNVCRGLLLSLRGDTGYTSNCYNQPSSGVWHHLAFVFDKSQSAGNGLAFYVDGELQGPTRSLEASTNTNSFGNDPVYIFSRGASRFSSGIVADLRIFNTALNAAQIQRIYKSGGLTSLMVLPANASVKQGSQVQLSAVGAYRDGAQRDLTSSVTWFASPTTVASVNSGGQITGTGSGVAAIQAYLGGVNGSALVSVIPPQRAASEYSVSASPAAVTTARRNQANVIAPTNVPSIVLDGNVHGVKDNGNTPKNTATLSLGTPAAGDLITCEVTFDSGNSNSLASIGDNVNGTYSAAVPAHLNTDRQQWYGIYYKENVSSYPTTVTITTTQHQQWLAIACQAWKGVASSNSLDTGFSQQRDAVGVPNPSTGSSKTPAGDGELIIASVGLRNSGSPTPGANYKLIDGATITKWWPEYWVQTTATATAGNYVWPSDSWTDMMAAFRPDPADDFTISANPASVTVVQGNQGSSTITTAISGGFNSAISLSASGVPNGTTVSFNPNPIAAPGNGSSTMTINVGASTAVGTYPITVTGNGGGIPHNTTVTLTVTAVPNFTISASPASLSVAQGNQSTSTITTTVYNGFNSAISLSASGVPTGTTVSFNPNPIPAPGSGNSTMTITVGGATAVGTYPITVTGMGGGTQQSTIINLTVIGSGIALDGNVHGVKDNGNTPKNTATLSLGTPAAGDLITCEVTFDSGNSNSLASIGDNVNGTYSAAVPAHLNTDRQQWYGIYYKENVSSYPTTVTITTTQHQQWLAIACQAWKGVASSNSLDTGFSQLRDAVGVPNPSTGSSKTPAGDGELIIAAVGLRNSGAPTPGANYKLIDGATITKWWPEYWVQTTATATAGNYVWPSDSWTDMMAAFRPDPADDFTISANPASVTVVQGNQGSSTIATAISGGFNSAISLSASGVPNGTTVSFNPNPIAAPGNGSSTMAINVGATTAVGTYPITVSGNGGGIQHNTTVTLTVTGTSDYTISANPASVTVVQGNQGSSTITTSINGGFNSAISLSAGGVPNGTTVSFNPNPIAAPGNGSSTMTISVGATTTVGTYPITVTCNGGGIQHNTTVTLTVTAAGSHQVSLTWDASVDQVIGYNAYRSLTQGGPYTKLNTSLIGTTSYLDTLVQHGYTYYYVTTAVNAQQVESSYSNEAVATVP